MADFKTRLFTERDELRDKIEKLGAFLDSDKSKGVDVKQLILMKMQLSTMNQYWECLNCRIEQL
jgi:hypothetical protein